MPPGQIVGESGATLKVGVGFTVTATVCGVPAQPALVAFTVYVMDAEGFAVTGEPVLALNAELGVQVYVAAPDAVKVVVLPLHIVGDEADAVIVGVGFTVIEMVFCAAAHPAAEVPFTVYVTELPGVAITGEPVLALNEALGVHVYVNAPLAVRLVELPEHIVGEPEDTVIVGVVFTVTATVTGAPVHPAVVPVTV